MESNPPDLMNNVQKPAFDGLGLLVFGNNQLSKKLLDYVRQKAKPKTAF